MVSSDATMVPSDVSSFTHDTAETPSEENTGKFSDCFSPIETSSKSSYTYECSKGPLRNFLVTKMIVKTYFCINFYFGKIIVSEV